MVYSQINAYQSINLYHVSHTLAIAVPKKLLRTTSVTKRAYMWHFKQRTIIYICLWIQTCVFLDLDFFGVHVLVHTDKSQLKVYW